jgi:hypothetical protein
LAVPSPLLVQERVASFDCIALSIHNINILLTDPDAPMSGPSSLFNLASALEKLKMPAPARPSTSMGFNPDAEDTPTPDVHAMATDDTALARPGFDRPRKQLGRAATSTAADFVSSAAWATSDAPTSQDASTSAETPKFPRPVMGEPGSLRVGSGAIMGTGRGRLMTKVSRNPTLSTVLGSPVKQGQGMHVAPNAEDNINGGEAHEELVSPADPKRSVRFTATDDMDISELSSDGPSRARDKEIFKQNASRRASLVSHSLTQSLSALPPNNPPTPVVMGPPATPPRREGLRSSSSNYPSTSSGIPQPSNREVPPPGSVKSAPAKIKADKEPQPALTVLKDCKVFVDIKSPNGEDAGDLFVDMLKGLGARVRS